MKVLIQSLLLAGRLLRALIRQPWYIAFTLVQPLIWLLLYGQLFKSIVALPGFDRSSYITFLTPGVIVMTALFSGGWNGMGVIAEIDRGILERLLISPVSRVSIIFGRLLSVAAINAVQTIILLGFGVLLGAKVGGGVADVLLLIVSSALLATSIAALSNALALLFRREESVSGAANLLLLPLTFLSSAFIAKSLLPPWMLALSRFNPVEWSVEANRAALMGHLNASFLLARLGLLIAFAACAILASLRTFRIYQRAI
jgi:ABC-2 type transport system permease protein